MTLEFRATCVTNENWPCFDSRPLKRNLEPNLRVLSIITAYTANVSISCMQFRDSACRVDKIATIPPRAGERDAASLRQRPGGYIEMFPTPLAYTFFAVLLLRQQCSFLLQGAP